MVSIFKKTSRETVDIITAFNLWNTLRARYGSIETFQMYKNFIHDRDFNLLLNQFLGTFLKEVKFWKIKQPAIR